MPRQRRCVSDRLHRLPALRAGPFDPSFARAMEGPLPHKVGKKERVTLSPDLFRGPVAFREEAPPDPGTGAGGSGVWVGEKRKCGARQRDGTANFAKAVATCS
ncbi:hypothetical protein GCM10017621_27060 [Maricaulis virginensis]|uniref:Uncharacterized protein n=1 Tax=Maricaulis virginensis TaxID=144022 RepID=A0A9W6INE6_9PROT|nr:hypothetical protein GCM10017621_27060 [Maricaulis virginensis]